MSEDKDFSDEELKEVTKKDTKLKKENSYTYWVNNDPNFFSNGTKTDSKPRPLDPISVAKLEESEKSKKNTPSAWNTAGTWEEKNLETKKILAALKSKFLNQSIANGKAKIINITKCDGDAKLILSRAKKRVGYTLNIEYEFEGTGDKSSTGTIKLSEFQDDGDYTFDVDSPDNPALADSVKSSVQNIVQGTQDIINGFREMEL